MPSYNKVELLGVLTREPETKPAASGVLSSMFQISLESETTNFRGEQIKEICLVDVEAVGRYAELVRDFFHAGMTVLVDGQLKYESVFDRESGKKRSRLYVVAQTLSTVDGEEKAL